MTDLEGRSEPVLLVQGLPKADPVAFKVLSKSFDVVVARNGDEALSVLRRVDCLAAVLDLDWLEESPYLLADRINAVVHRLPVVLFSSSANSVERLNGGLPVAHASNKSKDGGLLPLVEKLSRNYEKWLNKQADQIMHEARLLVQGADEIERAVKGLHHAT